jgi:type I restriction enzyme R subunit
MVSGYPTNIKRVLKCAIIGAIDALTTMSKQALDPLKVRDSVQDILLGPRQLYEALRANGGLTVGVAGQS